MIKVNFVAKENAPDRLVCEAEIVFDEGPLAGLKLVSFSLWRGPAGELYATVPSRAFGAGSERRYFDYVRSVDGKGEPVKRLKTWIIDQYHAAEGSAADPEPEGERAP